MAYSDFWESLVRKYDESNILVERKIYELAKEYAEAYEKAQREPIVYEKQKYKKLRNLVNLVKSYEQQTQSQQYARVKRNTEFFGYEEDED